MAGQTKVNGGGHTHGTQESIAQLKAMEVDALVNISAKGGLGSTIEAILAPPSLMYVMQQEQLVRSMIQTDMRPNAAGLQAKLQALGTVDPNSTYLLVTVTERDSDGFVAT